MTTNRDRAAGALRALVSYQQESPERIAERMDDHGTELIADLMVDLHHLADRAGLSWSRIDWLARQRHAEEA